MEVPKRYKPLMLRRENNEYLIFDIMDIIYIKVDNHACVFYIKGKRYSYIINVSLKSMIEVLPSEVFMQVHKSYVLNIYHIERIVDKTIYLTDEREIDVGRSIYFDQLLDSFIRPFQEEKKK